MDGTKARLLVATPELTDPNFHRAVVLVLEHNDDGALGLILNRPRLVGGAEAVPQWADRLAYPAQLHTGGPVSEESVIGLAIGPPDATDGISPLLGDRTACVQLGWVGQAVGPLRYGLGPADEAGAVQDQAEGPVVVVL